MSGRVSDSDTDGYWSKAEPGSEAYKERTAVPAMSAIDGMPREYRLLVHEYGYVDVYRAWKRGMPAVVIRERAERNGGVFKL